MGGACLFPVISKRWAGWTWLLREGKGGWGARCCKEVGRMGMACLYAGGEGGGG